MTASLSLVSVVIPAFNCADYVAEAIESVLAQTYQKIEIVVVDDGSTDRTSDVLKKYDSKIRLITQINKGVAAARNAGAEEASGELIVFLDADDVLFPEMVAKQGALFWRSPELGMAIAGWEIVTQLGEPISQVKLWQYRPTLDLETAVLYKPARPSATMLRRSWVTRVNGFDCNLSSAEDLDFLLRVMAAGCEAVWLPEVLASYRQHEGSLMTKGEDLLTNTHEVMTRFFQMAGLPSDICQLKQQERYQSLNWLGAKMYFAGRLSVMYDCLQQSLAFANRGKSHVPLDWFRAFGGYASEYGYELDAYELTQSDEWQRSVALALSLQEAPQENFQKSGEREKDIENAATGSEGKRPEGKQPEGKHVLLYSDDPGAGGILQCNHAIICRLAEAGYNASHAHFQQETPLAEQESVLGIKSIELGYHADSDMTRSLKDLEGAKRLFAAHQPDLVVFSDGWPFSNVAAKQAAYELNISYIVVLGFIEPSCVKYNYRDEVSYRELAALQYTRAQAVIAVSQANLMLLRELFDLPESVGRVIYNGRPAEYFEPKTVEARRRLRKEVSIPEDAVVCFTAGRFEAVKGYQYQVEAMRQLRESSVWEKLYFVWAGPGEGYLSRSNERELKRAVEGLGAGSKVKFLGQRWDVADWLDASDIFVLPSEAEGMPLSVMEAMAKGLPVVATAVSGIPEELGDTGVLLPDPNEKAEATVNELVSTIKAWADSEDERCEAGQRCRQRAIALFQQAAMLRNYEEAVNVAITKEKIGDLGRFTPEEARNIEVQFRFGCWLWASWDYYRAGNFESMDGALEKAFTLKPRYMKWPLLEWGKWFARFCAEQQETFEPERLMRSGVWQRLMVEIGQ